MVAPPNTVLELSTAPHERPVVRIDGKSYGLAVTRDFTIPDRLILARDLKALFTKLQSDLDDVTDEDLSRLTTRFEKLARQAFHDIPDAVFARLDYDQKMAVVHAFLAMAFPSPTPASSPDSSDSTGATPSGGT